tara:strand:+ start:589 stop:1749 length:1161 start_codon:yes stop_codon:yes gene_type:complete
MNNMAMQKLVNLYQFIDIDAFENSTKNPNDPNTRKIWEWQNQCTMPRHIYEKVLEIRDAEKTWSFPMTPADLRNEFQYYSKEVTQAQKFYIDLKEEKNRITEKELRACIGDCEFYCPYPKTFVQFDYGEQIMQILALDTEELYGAIGRDVSYSDTDNQDMGDAKNKITFRMSIFNKKLNTTIADMNYYTIDFNPNKVEHGFTEEKIEHIREKWHEANAKDKSIHDVSPSFGFTFWIENTVWKDLTDLSVHDDDRNYGNKSLNAWLQQIDTYWSIFMVYLKFPQIAQPKKVSGRKPIWLDVPMRNLKNTAFREKPKFEHTELVISMYDDSSSNSNGVNSTGRSAGTRFHSVRKHPRRLPNGKMTWVKAHFRGSKQEGIIFKDYKVER